MRSRRKPRRRTRAQDHRRVCRSQRRGTRRGCRDGRLVENLHVEAARRTLMIHDMIEKMEDCEKHLENNAVVLGDPHEQSSTGNFFEDF